MAKYVDYIFENCECECDKCGYSEIIDSNDYSEINRELKSNGWIIKKIDERWLEFCSEECFEKYKK